MARHTSTKNYSLGIYPRTVERLDNLRSIDRRLIPTLLRRALEQILDDVENATKRKPPKRKK
jgi:predicted DNA-binding protein